MPHYKPYHVFRWSPDWHIKACISQLPHHCSIFFFKTHVQPTGFLPSCNFTKSHTSFFALISSSCSSPFSFLFVFSSQRFFPSHWVIFNSYIYPFTIVVWRSPFSCWSSQLLSFCFFREDPLQPASSVEPFLSDFHCPLTAWCWSDDSVDCRLGLYCWDYVLHKRQHRGWKMLFFSKF